MQRRLAPSLLTPTLLLLLALGRAVSPAPARAQDAGAGPSTGGTAGTPAADPAVALARAIDAYLDARIARDGIAVAPPCDDAEFLRRVSLDVVGEVPRPREVVAFLGDADAGKRARKLDELLARPEAARAWAEFWTDVIDRESTTKQREEQFKTAARDWLTARFEENLAFDEVVRRLISAEGLVKDNGAAGYVISYTADKLEPDPMALAATTARVFMGIQIECAQCHDHPFASWKRDDFMGFAAYFARARLERGRIGTPPAPRDLAKMTPEEREKAIADYRKMQVLAPVGIKEAAQGELHVEVQTARNPGDMAAPPPAMAPRTPDGKAATYVVAPRFFVPGAATASEGGTRREVLARLVTSEGDPYFALCCANRIWGRLTGRPLVAPTEDLSDPSAPHDPELLALLAKGLRDLRYDHRAFVRALCLTSAYARSSKLAHGDARPDAQALRRAEQAYAQGVVRPIDARPLARAFIAASLLGERGLDEAGPLMREGVLRRFEGVFGGANLDPKHYEETIPEALFLMNGPSPGTPQRPGGGGGAGANRPAGPRGPALETRRARAIERLLDRESDERERVTQVYLAALARPATKDEVADAIAFVRAAPERAQGYEDLLWALLNSAEFRFNR